MFRNISVHSPLTKSRERQKQETYGKNLFQAARTVLWY
jgi:hypothetical protein